MLEYEALSLSLTAGYQHLHYLQPVCFSVPIAPPHVELQTVLY